MIVITSQNSEFFCSFKDLFNSFTIVEHILDPKSVLKRWSFIGRRSNNLWDAHHADDEASFVHAGPNVSNMNKREIDAGILRDSSGSCCADIWSRSFHSSFIDENEALGGVPVVEVLAKDRIAVVDKIDRRTAVAVSPRFSLFCGVVRSFCDSAGAGTEQNRNQRYRAAVFVRFFSLPQLFSTGRAFAQAADTQDMARDSVWHEHLQENSTDFPPFNYAQKLPSRCN